VSTKTSAELDRRRIAELTERFLRKKKLLAAA